MDYSFWLGKRVFITGHTGFKGGWLALWLSHLGAEVYGYSLPPTSQFNFFNICNLDEYLKSHVIGDIRDSSALYQALEKSNADMVFHFAAQPLVKHSYKEPVITFETNVIGTVNLLEAIRKIPSVKAVVNITTDKCYENKEWEWPYREYEALGGYDPYSSSKACSELVSSAYRQSFFSKLNIQLATARAGNVIGGGDWAEDRLLPDFFRAIDQGEVLAIRSPNAVRPWQHVLEPISGYIHLAENLYLTKKCFSEAWNFGPDNSAAESVQWIVEKLCSQIEGAAWKLDGTSHLHEANILKLDSSKAKARLGWHQRWSLAEAIEHTVAWHKAWKSGKDMMQFSIGQINEYTKESE